MSNSTENLNHAVRKVDREWRKANDPWFGKRRRAGEVGRTKSKAAQNKKACRGRTI